MKGIFTTVICLLLAIASATAANPSGLAWKSGWATDVGGDASFAAFRGAARDLAGTWHCRMNWGYIAAGGCRNYVVNGQTVTQAAGLDGPTNSGWPKNETQWHAVALLAEDYASDLASCAAGAYNSHFEALGQSIVNVGLNVRTMYIRLGWEANGDWYAWGVSLSSNDQWKNNKARTAANFVGCFQNAVKSIKQYANNVQISWNMNKDSSADEHGMYPGDAFVDIIDVDYYNSWPTSTTLDQFNGNINASDGGTRIGRGLNHWYQFAVAHKKKFALSEWGITSDGDYPAYIQGMFDFFKMHANDIAWETYFNAQSDGFRIYNPSTNPNPKSAAEYKALYTGK